jgi:hypothetical protein
VSPFDPVRRVSNKKEINMTGTETVGVTVHFVADGLTVHTGAGFRSEAQVMRRGQTLVVTPEVREANTGRDGRCIFDLTEEQQRARFGGKIMFRSGAFPEDEERLTPGSPEWDHARSAALQAAALLPDPEDQRAAAARARGRFGVPSSARSRTVATYGPR